jgi:cytidylate kinase
VTAPPGAPPAAEEDNMNVRGTSERSSEALVRAGHHWAARRQAETPGSAPAAFTIAISREVGARGTTVARAVGERLGWQVYDHELLEQIAREQNLRVSLLESVDERRISWIEECLESFGEIPAVSGSAYVRYLTETMLSLAAHGECVIVGRGAAQVLPPASTLRVRLVAPREQRVEWLMRERGLPHDEAARRVTEIEHERTRFIRDHYQKDPTDQHGYDLVLNSGRFAVAECAGFIVDALHRLTRADRAG